jgi:3-hydroxyisobutyrate dehydrogenase-like beta-hydroxyacid dehydrogenase
MEAARDLDIPLQVTANLQQVLTALVIQGEGKSDHSAIAKYVEKLAGIEIKKH